jgi:hypothetical protein
MLERGILVEMKRADGILQHSMDCSCHDSLSPGCRMRQIDKLCRAAPGVDVVESKDSYQLSLPPDTGPGTTSLLPLLLTGLNECAGLPAVERVLR